MRFSPFKTPLLFVLMAVGMAVAGCGRDANVVRVGMTEAEVRKVFGPPEAVQELFDVPVPGASRSIDTYEFERAAPERIWHYMEAEVIFNHHRRVLRVDRRKVSWP